MDPDSVRTVGTDPADPNVGPVQSEAVAPMCSEVVRRAAKSRRKSTLSHISVRQHVVLTINDFEQLTIGEVLDRVGFGWYQVQVYLSVFGALMAEASSVAMVASCSEPISKEFDIEDSPVAKAGLCGFLYMGIQFGTVFVGQVGDRYGRRIPLLMGYVGIIVFGVCCSFATGIKALYALLFFLGLSGGFCVPCAVITLSETMPADLRGGAGAALGIAFRFGTLWSAIAARIWMPQLNDGPWRFLILAPVVPATCFLTFSLISPAARQDTPHYLAIAGKQRSLISTLNLMAESNRRPEMRLISAGDIQFDKTANSVTVREVVGMMTSYPLWANFLVMVALFFCKEFVAGGTTAYWPVTFAHLHKIATRSPVQIHAEAQPASVWPEHAASSLLQLGEVDPEGLTASSRLIVTELISFPGIGAAVWAMLYLPRRMSLVAGAFLAGTGGLLLLAMYGSFAVLGIVGIGMIQLFFPTWQMVTMLLGSEIFPTQVRGTAYSFGYFVGRFGSELAQVAVHRKEQWVFPVVMASLAVIAMGLVLFLPETKGAELANYCHEPAGSEGDRGEKDGGSGNISKTYGALGEATRAPSGVRGRPHEV